MNSSSLRSAVILAAGKGTRFKSDRPKVLHRLCGRPMISYLLDRLNDFGIERPIVVVGEDDEEVQSDLRGYDLEFVRQPERLGTGHAVMSARSVLEGRSGTVIVLYGDTPFVTRQTMERLFSTLESTGADECLLTVELEDPTGYGRIVRDETGEICDIVEEKDATEEQSRIREINAGFACFRIESLLEHLAYLKNDNAAGEYYLTDLVRIIRSQNGRVTTVTLQGTAEIVGINDRIDLSEAEKRLRAEINRQWMGAGVTMLDPDSTRIDSQVSLGKDCIIYPGVILEGNTIVGDHCTLHAYVYLCDAVLESSVTIEHCSIVRKSRIPAGRRVGPHGCIDLQAPLDS